MRLEGYSQNRLLMALCSVQRNFCVVNGMPLKSFTQHSNMVFSVFLDDCGTYVGRLSLAQENRLSYRRAVGWGQEDSIV